MQLKGTLLILGLAAAACANADSFAVQYVSSSGDFAVNGNAVYWDPGINQVAGANSIGIYTPGQNKSVTIVSQASALGNYYFTGESFMTFAGAISWAGAPDPTVILRLTSQIYDLDNGLQYSMVSTMNYTGTQWGQNLHFARTTRNVRWTDTIEFISGNTGTQVQWNSTNHTMTMIQAPVPEPSSLLAIGAFAFGIRRRKQHARAE